MIPNVFGYIASDNLGYAKVELVETIAKGDPGCRVTFLVMELNHRVKNMLAIVQSICTQTLRGTDAGEDVQQLLERRLCALAGVHDMITREVWEGVGLSEIVRTSLAPFGGAEGQGSFVVAEGDKVAFSPRLAINLGLAFHELATNAVKYGALSTNGGHVVVEWRTEGGHIRLLWQEHDGPPVMPPARKGFGSRLIARVLAGEQGGEVNPRFDPSGLVCEFLIPAPEQAGA